MCAHLCGCLCASGWKKQGKKLRCICVIGVLPNNARHKEFASSSQIKARYDEVDGNALSRFHLPPARFHIDFCTIDRSFAKKSYSGIGGSSHAEMVLENFAEFVASASVVTFDG